MRGTDNADTLIGTGDNDSIYGAGGNDLIQGQGGVDVLVGQDGDDTLYGGDGNDYLIGGVGNDVLFGGEGVDWADYADAASSVKVDLGVSKAQDTHGAGRDILISIERVYGSGFGDALAGNNYDNLLSGADGADTLSGAGGRDSLIGGDGDDVLSGGAGRDYLEGGAGDDTYIVNGRADQVSEGADAGTDTVSANFSYHLGANLENLTLTGANPLSGWGNELANQINGGSGGDHLYGLGGGDTISGGGGNDILDAGGSTSQTKIILDGGAGDDHLSVGKSYFADISGGEGDDWLDFSSWDHSIGVDLNSSGAQFTNAGLLTITGVENIEGSLYGDYLIGTKGSSELRGEGGADLLFGVGVNNTLAGGSGDDTLYMLGHNAVIRGGQGSDTLSFFDVNAVEQVGAGWTVDLRVSGQQDAGNGRMLTITGVENIEDSAFDDVFTSNSQSNAFSAGRGGDDTFRFFSAEDVNGDSITGFQKGDHVDLSGIDANTMAKGDQAFQLVHAFDGHAGQLAVTVQDDTTTVSLDINGDQVADATLLIAGDHHEAWNFVL